MWIAKAFSDPAGDQALSKMMKRYYQAGRNEGLQTATGIIMLALHEYYNFGNKRLEKLMECVGKESIKMDENPTKFNVDFYIQKLNEIMKNQIEIYRPEKEEVCQNLTHLR